MHTFGVVKQLSYSQSALYSITDTTRQTQKLSNFSSILFCFNVVLNKLSIVRFSDILHNKYTSAIYYVACMKR